jgi:hypothetical protein
MDYYASSSGSVPAHNSLSGLQGGNGTTEEYHLTAAQATAATQNANGSQQGLLSSADWTTFNNKQAALGFTPNQEIYKNKSVISATAITLAENNYIYTKTITGNTTFTIDSSALASIASKVVTFEVLVTMASLYAIAFTGVTFVTTPTIAVAGTYCFVIRTRDGGSTWIGNLAYKEP